MRYDRMSGLDSEQLDELVWRIKDQLEEPWHKGIGRPKDLSLREAVVVACGYMRQNITQEVWAEIFDTSQSVISGIITKFTPLIEASTEEDRPTVDEAKEAAAREQTVLVDGFLAPTWSWRDTPELWSGKHKTTGFNGQAIANLRGDLAFVSEPVTGHNHDMTALAETETADIIAAAYSGIGDKGYQGPRISQPSVWTSTPELIAAQLPQIFGMHDANESSQVWSCSRGPSGGNQDLGRREDTHRRAWAHAALDDHRDWPGRPPKGGVGRRPANPIGEPCDGAPRS